MLLYDAQATESGGLTFGGQKDPQGQISRLGHFSFDNYSQDQMLTISAADDGSNHRAEIKMIDQPNRSIEDYLDLLDSIQQLPPEEQQQAIDDFFETHPRGAGLRTLLGAQTYPSLPAASQSTLNLRDDQGRERTRLPVAADGTPSLEFLDATGNVTHRNPPN